MGSTIVSSARQAEIFGSSTTVPERVTRSSSARVSTVRGRPDLPPPPAVALIVRQDREGRWRDDNGGDWTAFVSGAAAWKSGRPVGWTLLDHDLAVVDARSLEVRYDRSNGEQRGFYEGPDNRLVPDQTLVSSLTRTKLGSTRTCESPPRLPFQRIVPSST